MENKLNNFRYYFFSFIYDLMLGPFYKRFIKRLITAVNAQPGREVLEVGIGTGITIPYYQPNKQVTGIDPSSAMLKLARKKTAFNLKTTFRLEVASAENHAFDLASFDQVIFCSTLSVLEHPKAVLQAQVNQLKEDGSIFILNHFTPEKGILHFTDKLLTPAGKLLGFRSFFPLNTLIDSQTMLVTPLLQGYWSIIQIKRVPVL